MLAKLTRRWTKRWNDASKSLADYFAQDVSDRSDAQLKSILKKAGISVQFKMTPAQRDIIKATVNANVSLIKSIPQQYLGQVEGIVMRSVQTGRDLGQLSKDLQTRLGVTKKRAALISRDQNNKATSALQRARQQEIGITEAVWMHSHGGKEPRPTHEANDGKRYKVATGWFDPAVKKNIWPGELINCRCTSRSVLPDFANAN
jgi:SPP1 gp7 family putative phage head morphogenesis protein